MKTNLIENGGYEVPSVKTIVFKAEQTFASSAVTEEMWGDPGMPGADIEQGNTYQW